MSPVNLINRSLANARGDINDGDLLLFRGVGPIGRVIAWAGRGEYSHAGMAAWWGGELMCIELREFRGGRAVTLASQVDAYRERIDVYAPQPGAEPFDAAKAVKHMRWYAGREYSYWGVAKLALIRVPYVSRWLGLTTSFDDATAVDRLPAFCSAGVAEAYCTGGVDPVPNLSNNCTEPADLARSKFFAYQFTLSE